MEDCIEAMNREVGQIKKAFKDGVITEKAATRQIIVALNYWTGRLVNLHAVI